CDDLLSSSSHAAATLHYQGPNPSKQSRAPLTGLLASAGALRLHSFCGSLLPALPTLAVPALHVATPLHGVGVQPSLPHVPVLPRMPVASAPLFPAPRVVSRYVEGSLFGPLPGAAAPPVLWQTGAAALCKRSTARCSRNCAYCACHCCSVSPSEVSQGFFGGAISTIGDGSLA